jgi:hypothetical protein
MIIKDFKGPGFSMQVPTDWYITSSPQIQAMFISPPQGEGLQGNLMVTMNPVEDGVTVEEIASEAKKNQLAQYPEYELLAEGLVEGSENQVYTREYKWFNEKKALRVHQRQIMYLVDQMLYILTTTRPETDTITEAIKRLDAQMEMMLQSFSLEGNENNK